MKRITVFFSLLLTLTAAHAQQKINFVTQGNLRTVFDMAKAQHKKVFLEVYSPDCHVCQSFEPIFENAEVAKYYNEHFICYRLDANKMETLAFIQKQKLDIQSTPTFLFYDADVHILHQAALEEGQNKTDIVINEAKKAVSK